MKTLINSCLGSILAILLSACENKKTEPNLAMIDPLPSWNDGALKRSIINYVNKASDSSSAGFVPAESRIATFDNDGTLWAEKPLVQELFAYYMVKRMIAQKPSLKTKQPFKAVLGNDKTYFKKGGEKALLELINATHTGMTEDAFEAAVHDFFATAVYPRHHEPLIEITYQPQLELLALLRDHGFKTYICSGGTIELIRGISEQFYHVPREQVIGSIFKYQFIDSNRAVMRLPGVALLNDKGGKPVSIQMHIGRRPVFACGNEGGAGDLAMLLYSQGNKFPSFQLLINHDDANREYAYQEKDSLSLKTASKNNWHVASMQKDWNQVFHK